MDRKGVLVLLSVWHQDEGSAAQLYRHFCNDPKVRESWLLLSRPGSTLSSYRHVPPVGTHAGPAQRVPLCTQSCAPFPCLWPFLISSFAGGKAEAASVLDLSDVPW